MESPISLQGPDISYVESHEDWTKGKRRPIWTKLFVFINTTVFFYTWSLGGDFFLPSPEALIASGAKDLPSILGGEYWRLLTAAFVHVGVIHFAINNMALFYIGQNIERVMGSSWYLATYLYCAVFSTLTSCVFTPDLSAGASGAIFGLVGVGFVMERLMFAQVFKRTGRKLRRGTYTGLVVINVLIGFIMTEGAVRIDNGAHLGGLFAGCLIGYAFLKFRPNHLTTRNPTAGMLWIFVLTICTALLAVATFFRQQI